MLEIDNNDLTLRKTLRVLIVDDEKPLIDVMTIFLTKIFNYLESNVYSAINGEDALNLVTNLYHEKKLLNIILTDIRMQKVDGIEFCTKVKDLYQELWKETVVIAITGISLKEEQKELEEKINFLGISLIYKPFEYKSFISEADRMFVAKKNNNEH